MGPERIQVAKQPSISEPQFPLHHGDDPDTVRFIGNDVHESALISRRKSLNLTDRYRAGSEELNRVLPLLPPGCVAFAQLLHVSVPLFTCGLNGENKIVLADQGGCSWDN